MFFVRVFRVCGLRVRVLVFTDSHPSFHARVCAFLYDTHFFLKNYIIKLIFVHGDLGSSVDLPEARLPKFVNSGEC